MAAPLADLLLAAAAAVSRLAVYHWLGSDVQSATGVGVVPA